MTVESGIQNTGIAIFMLKFTLGQPAADITTGNNLYYFFLISIYVSGSVLEILGYFVYLYGAHSVVDFQMTVKKIILLRQG